MLAKNRNYQNILIVRTDRIGDVVLTTPAIEALRRAYPKARISIMVNPLTRDLVDGNPYLNEVIIYDKKDRHKGFLGFWTHLAFGCGLTKFFKFRFYL